MEWIPQAVLRKCKVSTKERSRDDKGQRDRNGFICGETGGKKGGFPSPSCSVTHAIRMKYFTAKMQNETQDLCYV
jgi:hypothetical protein